MSMPSNWCRVHIDPKIGPTFATQNFLMKLKNKLGLMLRAKIWESIVSQYKTR